MRLTIKNEAFNDIMIKIKTRRALYFFVIINIVKCKINDNNFAILYQQKK